MKIKRFIPPFFKAFFPLMKGVLFDIPKMGRHKEKYDINVRHDNLKKLIKRVNKALNAEIIIFGEENILSTSSLYISNHLSASDAILIYEILNKMPSSFVSKIELEKNKIIKDAISQIDGLFMDRNDLRQSLKVMGKVQDTLKEGSLSWVIYAEGTRLHDPSSLINEMHSGSFRPAIKANAPIVPVATFGSHLLLKNKPYYKRYPIYFSFLKPIYPDEYKGMKTEEIAKMVESRIQKEISFKLRKLHHLEMIKDKKYRLHYISE